MHNHVIDFETALDDLIDKYRKRGVTPAELLSALRLAALQIEDEEELKGYSNEEDFADDAQGYVGRDSGDED